jgi:hypothetical protein
MKMTPAHYEALKAKVVPLVAKIATHRESLKNDPRVKDLDKRLLWDVFYATRIMGEYSPQEFAYNNTHIETAMRSIFNELNVYADRSPSITVDDSPSP